MSNPLVSLPAPENVVVIGAGRIAKSCAQAILNHTKKLQCIEPDNTGFPVFRGWCERNQVPYKQLLVKNEIDSFFMEITAQTLIVSAYNLHLFSPAVLAKKNLNIINFHNSILPRHRGRNSPTWSIFEQDEYSGVTWHFVGHKVDKGQVIRAEKIALDKSVTALQLTQQTLDLGARVFNEFAGDLFSGKLALSDSTCSDAKETFHLSKEVPNNGLLDTNWSLEKISAFLRSLDYSIYPIFPRPKVKLFGDQYLIDSYEISESSLTGITKEGNQLLIGDGRSMVRLSISLAEKNP